MLFSLYLAYSHTINVTRLLLTVSFVVMAQARGIDALRSPHRCANYTADRVKCGRAFVGHTPCTFVGSRCTLGARAAVAPATAVRASPTSDIGHTVTMWNVSQCPAVRTPACACYLPPSRGDTLLARRAAWADDQAWVAASVSARQHGCSATTQWFRLDQFPRGVGTFLIYQLNRLLNVWSTPTAAAVPFPPGRTGDGGPDLWASSDASLPCDTFYGCYWQPLHTPCTSRAINESQRNALPM